MAGREPRPISLKQALARHASGDLQGAGQAYRAVLSRAPGNHQALHGLGLVMHQRGRHELAARLLGQAIALHRHRADYHYHLGEVRRALAHWEAAVDAYRTALALNDREADYHFGLGKGLAGQGARGQAVEAYRSALERAPGDAEIHNNLGNVLAGEGQRDAALAHLRQAILLAPGYADAHHNLSLVLGEAGRLEEALGHARRACEAAPEKPEPLINLGRLLDARGDPAAALACYRTVLAGSPTSAALLAALAAGLRAAGDPGTAIGVYRRALAMAPEVLQYRVGLCHCLIQLQRFAEAEAQSRAALDIDPECAAALGTLAVCRQTRGHFRAAAELLERALALAPTLTEAAYLLATNGEYVVGDAQKARWLALADDPSLPADKRVHLNFAIARVYERRQRYAVAFQYFQRANDAKARLYPFDAARHSAWVQRIVDVFTPAFFAARREFGDPDARPIFIVGMPRSGSTLVEQILACHPELVAIGEHAEMRDILRDLPARVGRGEPAPECCRALSAAGSREFARRYLQSLPEAAGAATRVSDKMLGNFLRLGVIALLFPRARVLHCVRAPLDTCVSCYSQDFAQGLRFTTTLPHLASFYRDYRRLMRHWQQVLPLPIMDVEYEALVNDPQAVSRKLLGFCDLPWDPRCLSPQRAQRALATASVWQARQPVYTSSVARWQRYRAYLDPLRDSLADLGTGDAG